MEGHPGPVPYRFVALRSVVLLSVLGLLAVGCGGSESVETSSTTRTTSAPTTTTTTTTRPIETPESTTTKMAVGSDAAEEAVVLGLERYDANCRPCHAAAGTGISGLGLRLAGSSFIESHSDTDLLAFLKVGRAVSDPANTVGLAMPARGGNPELSDAELSAIVGYLRTLEAEAPTGATPAATTSTTGPGESTPSEPTTTATPPAALESEVAIVRTPADGFGIVNAVTEDGAGGFIAVGEDWDTGSSYVWASPDGLSWQAIPRDRATFEFTSLQSVAAAGPGFVAVGFGYSPDLDFGALVLLSPDGRSWTRLPYEEELFGGIELRSVTAGGPGVVAVGARDDTVGVVLTSHDGATWESVSFEPSDPESDLTLRSVTLGPAGLVAVGNESSYWAATATGAILASTDGISWSRVPVDDLVSEEEWGLSTVTAGGPGYVGVGGTAGGDIVIVTSRNGRTWERVPHDPSLFEEGAVIAVTATPQGLVAVGGGAGSEDKTALVLASPDGSAWQRVPIEESPLNQAAMFAVASGGPGFVVVGVTEYSSDYGLTPAMWAGAFEGDHDRLRGDEVRSEPDDLRFDGIYVSTATPVYGRVSYLRFSPDATMIGAKSDAPLEDVRRDMLDAEDGPSRWTYTVAENGTLQGSFGAGDERVDVTVAVAAPESLQVRTVSLFNGRLLVEEYRFSPD